MSDATAQIRIDIVANGAEAGANRVNRALDSIGGKTRSIGAANDNLKGTFDRLGSSMGGAAGHGGKLGAIFDNIRERASGAAPEVANLTNTLGKMGPQAAIIGGIALAIGAVGVAAIQAASQTQQWMAQLETATKSSTKAQESYAALVQFAAKTPFDLGQSIDAFRKLRNLGLSATEERLTSFGNTAAAMGKSLNQMIEAVADASTGEFERLKEFGIKSKTEGDKVKFTFQGVSTTVGKNSKEITQYLENIGKTTFGGAMAKQMDTLKGAFSNVQDNMQQMLAAIGGGALGQAVKEITKAVANGIGVITPFLASIGNFVGGIISGVGSILNGLGQVFSGIGQATALQNLLDGLTVTFNLLGQGAQVLGSVIGATFNAIGTIAGNVRGFIGEQFGDLLKWMGISFDQGGRSWANSIVGILRAGKYVASSLPQIFAAVIADIGDMFAGLGKSIAMMWNAKSLADLSKALGVAGNAVGNAGGRTRKVVGSISDKAGTIYADEKGADASIGRLLGRTSVKPKLDAGVDAKPDPANNKDKKDKEAAEAERRAKREKEFWDALKGEVETAKRLPLAAEDYRKQLELQKILGHELNALDVASIGLLMQKARTAKFITTALDDHNKRSAELANQETQLRAKLLGATDEQLALEKTIADFRLNAQRQGVDLQSEGYKAAEAQLSIDEQRAQVLDRQNASLARGLDVARQYSGSFARQQEMVGLGKSRQDLDTLWNGGNNGGKLTQAQYQEAAEGLRKAGVEIANRWKDEFGARIDQIGEQFGFVMGQAISKFGKLVQALNAAAQGDWTKAGPLGSIIGLLGKNAAGKDTAFGTGANAGASKMLDSLFKSDTWAKPFKSMSDGFSDLKGVFTGSNGGFMQALGKVAGGAAAGAQIGSLTNSVLGAVGIKLNGTGSQLGGALGSAFGPLGSILGSIGGGIIGNLFTSAPRGKAIITSGKDAQISGNKASVREALTGTAGSIQTGLQNIATQLGGDLGNFMVSIGKYKDSYRVSSTGSSNVDGKKTSRISGLLYDGKDEAQAISIAIKDAILDGAITGLSDLMNKALKTYAGNVDKAVNTALQMKSFEDDFKALTEPMRYAVESITTPLAALRKSMIEVGASTADLTKLDEYRAKKLDAVLKDQVSGFQSLLDSLNGDGGGVTALTQLTQNLGKLDPFKADVAAGKTIDQDAFTALADKIMGNVGNVYGTNTTEFQDIIGSLKGLTTGAITNATSAFNAAAGSDSTTKAITDQTNAVTASIGITNDYLRQIANAVSSGALTQSQGAALSSNATNSKDGRLLQAF